MKLTNEEREKFYVELCAKLGEKQPLPQACFCDLMLYGLCGIKYSISPMLFEEWLEKRKGIVVKEGESLNDAIVRKFGKRAAELAIMLV